MTDLTDVDFGDTAVMVDEPRTHIPDDDGFDEDLIYGDGDDDLDDDDDEEDDDDGDDDDDDDGDDGDDDEDDEDDDF